MSQKPDIDSIRERLKEAEWAWGWHDAGPDPHGDEVREGYGHHMDQMLYRLPVDSQTFDMKTSIETLLADLRTALDRVETAATAMDDAASFITTHGTFHNADTETRIGWNQACVSNADYLNGKAKELRGESDG